LFVPVVGVKPEVMSVRIEDERTLAIQPAVEAGAARAG